MGFNDQQNKRISNYIVDELRLNPISDNIPKTVIPSIQPTFEVNRKFCNVIGSASGSTTSATLLTTSATLDTYITGAVLSIIKDATQDTANGKANLNITINGTSTSVLAIALLTLTAQSETISLSFPTPIKVDRNTTITVTRASSTVGTFVIAGSVVGYTETTGDVTP